MELEGESKRKTFLEMEKQLKRNLERDLGRKLGTEKKMRIAMVSDFFLPNLGGVESHIFQLSQCLIERGHHVIVLTHYYPNKKGIRYLTNGLKVYYLPQLPIYNGNSLPSVFPTVPIFRNIFIRESIELIHCHQAFSTLTHEAIVSGSLMGYPTIFTDHSLFGFQDTSAILTNKLLRLVLSDTTYVICVSHTSKENTHLRAGYDEHRIFVIPNAVDCTDFTPSLVPSPLSQKITVVSICRLTYRKGADLLISVIPALCKKDPNVDFVIGGDGPKFAELEQMREAHQLHDRVKLLGAVQRSDLRSVLLQGDVFISCSLTEAFCIAVVEAVSCGLRIVATDVGGVPEVLPEDMINLAEPSPPALLKALEKTVQQSREVPHNPWEWHHRVKEMYHWRNVAERTIVVYEKAMEAPKRKLVDKMRNYFLCGSWAGKIWCCVIICLFLFHKFIEWLYPREEIDLVPPVNLQFQPGEKYYDWEEKREEEKREEEKGRGEEKIDQKWEEER